MKSLVKSIINCLTHRPVYYYSTAEVSSLAKADEAFKIISTEAAKMITGGISPDCIQYALCADGKLRIRFAKAKKESADIIRITYINL